jgi:isovaleryl-CoA dehydrogenase
MLFVNNLNQNGNHEQKIKYLPKACTGEAVCGMGMSEPSAGTDVMGMKTTAVKSADGKHYVINGAKMWITNGTVDGKTTGDTFLVYAKTGKGRAAHDVSAFLIEKGMPGFTLGQKIENKLGMRASMTAELSFSDVHVPAENLIGKEGGATLCMMRNLEIERVTLAAMALGIAKRSIDVMTK